MNNLGNASRLLKAKFSDFIEDVLRGLNTPDRKCLADLFWGFIKGGNVNVADMARAMEGKDCIIEIWLTRLLKRFDATLLDDRIAERVKSYLESPYLLVLDESDVSKPSARKMEGL